MKKYILPFTLDVEMRAYHNKAFPLGVMKANISAYDIWLCNKLINCIYKLDGSFDVCNRDMWFEDEGLVTTQSMRLKPITYNKCMDIIRLNKEMIEEGSYITGDYNEFFIYEKFAYKRYNFSHDYIIFGYDDEKRIFKSAGYLADGSYDFFDIEYDAYYKSIIHNNVAQAYLEYRQVNKEYVPKIEVLVIKEKLSCYLESKKDYIGYRPDGYCYGIEVWNKFIDYIASIGKNKLDYRFSRVYMEHKEVMTKRLKKLTELGLLKNKNLTENYYLDICVPAQVLHSLCMKYNLSKDTKIIAKIIENIRNINKQEKILIEKIIVDLKN